MSWSHLGHILYFSSVKNCSYTVDYPSFVQMVDPAQHLVEQEGHPLVVQLHFDHLAEIGIHVLHDEVYNLPLLTSIPLLQLPLT